MSAIKSRITPDTTTTGQLDSIRNSGLYVIYACTISTHQLKALLVLHARFDSPHLICPTHSEEKIYKIDNRSTFLLWWYTRTTTGQREEKKKYARTKSPIANKEYLTTAHFMYRILTRREKKTNTTETGEERKNTWSKKRQHRRYKFKWENKRRARKAMAKVKRNNEKWM